MTTNEGQPINAVYVADSAMESPSPLDIVWSNFLFQVDLLNSGFPPESLCREALCSFAVEYFRGQMNNGGFSLFVYNTNWAHFMVDSLEEGLRLIGAHKHHDLFRRCAALVAGLPPSTVQDFTQKEYPRESPERTLLGTLDKEFFALTHVEDLISRNADWLRSVPNLRPVPQSEMEALLETAGMP